VGEDIIAIFKATVGVDRHIRRHVLDEGGYTRGARSHL
jgi:hypothetical protein